ncbi:hypothetical protein NDU88_003397 [Pleurodeles waltl]|uniref:Uncharacterized protein n=1 Tax=Pleurodeles waltl TaxID=8319 RepID=A0AAV7NGQ7_PLEWA|nr:hypothetical protein NDU88_003397 [Pleurodeles waltl]
MDATRAIDTGFPRVSVKTNNGLQKRGGGVRRRGETKGRKMPNPDPRRGRDTRTTTKQETRTQKEADSTTTQEGRDSTRNMRNPVIRKDQEEKEYK